MNRELVSLPSWFPAHQAAAILRQKGNRFALIADRTGIGGVACVDSLEAAPRTKSVLWCAMSLVQSVTAEAPAEEALEMMTLYSVDCLPVVAGGSAETRQGKVTRGGLIVGIVTRQDLESVRADERRLSAPNLAAA